MNTKPTVCALYTRVSSRNQLEKDYSSLQTQRERLEAYCRSQDNYIIHRVYEDGAYSAENLDRPALKQMLTDIRAGKVNCVLAYKIDRLTRSVKDFHVLMDLFDRLNVKFVSITQSLDTQHPMGRLLRNILLDFAQFEREMTADRTRDKMHQRAQKGMWNGGGIPYGYQNDNKRLVPDEEEAPRVAFMFEQFSRNPSLACLRDELDRRGWQTRKGLPWTKSVLDYILSNPVYIGKTLYDERCHEGTHKGIISEALFNRVKAIPRDRRRVNTALKRPFLLKGLLTCSDCGSRMTPHYVQKRRVDGSINRIAYYRCTRTMKYNNRVCRIKQLNADRAEATVIEHLHDLSQNQEAVNAAVEDLNRDLRAKVQPLEREAAQTRQRIAELEVEIDRFVQALGKGRISVERLEREMEQRQAHRTTLEDRLRILHQQINEEAAYDYNAEAVRQNLAAFRHSFDALTPDEKHEALQCMLKQINVLPEKLVLEVYELSDFEGGSQKRSEWLQR